MSWSFCLPTGLLPVTKKELIKNNKNLGKAAIAVMNIAQEYGYRDEIGKKISRGHKFKFESSKVHDFIDLCKKRKWNELDAECFRTRVGEFRNLVGDSLPNEWKEGHKNSTMLSASSAKYYLDKYGWKVEEFEKLYRLMKFLKRIEKNKVSDLDVLYLKEYQRFPPAKRNEAVHKMLRVWPVVMQNIHCLSIDDRLPLKKKDKQQLMDLYKECFNPTLENAAKVRWVLNDVCESVRAVRSELESELGFLTLEQKLEPSRKCASELKARNKNKVDELSEGIKCCKLAERSIKKMRSGRCHYLNENYHNALSESAEKGKLIEKHQCILCDEKKAQQSSYEADKTGKAAEPTVETDIAVNRGVVNKKTKLVEWGKECEKEVSTASQVIKRAQSLVATPKNICSNIAAHRSTHVSIARDLLGQGSITFRKFRKDILLSPLEIEDLQMLYVAAQEITGPKSAEKYRKCIQGLIKKLKKYTRCDGVEYKPDPNLTGSLRQSSVFIQELLVKLQNDDLTMVSPLLQKLRRVKPCYSEYEYDKNTSRIIYNSQLHSVLTEKEDVELEKITVELERFCGDLISRQKTRDLINLTDKWCTIRYLWDVFHDSEDSFDKLEKAKWIKLELNKIKKDIDKLDVLKVHLMQKRNEIVQLWEELLVNVDERIERLENRQEECDKAKKNKESVLRKLEELEEEFVPKLKDILDEVRKKKTKISEGGEGISEQEEEILEFQQALTLNRNMVIETEKHIKKNAAKLEYMVVNGDEILELLKRVRKRLDYADQIMKEICGVPKEEVDSDNEVEPEVKEDREKLIGDLEAIHSWSKKKRTEKYFHKEKLFEIQDNLTKIRSELGILTPVQAEQSVQTQYMPVIERAWEKQIYTVGNATNIPPKLATTEETYSIEPAILARQLGFYIPYSMMECYLGGGRFHPDPYKIDVETIAKPFERLSICPGDIEEWKLVCDKIAQSLDRLHDLYRAPNAKKIIEARMQLFELTEMARSWKGLITKVIDLYAEINDSTEMLDDVRTMPDLFEKSMVAELYILMNEFPEFFKVSYSEKVKKMVAKLSDRIDQILPNDLEESMKDIPVDMRNSMKAELLLTELMPVETDSVSNSLVNELEVNHALFSKLEDERENWNNKVDELTAAITRVYDLVDKLPIGNEFFDQAKQRLILQVRMQGLALHKIRDHLPLELRQMIRALPDDIKKAMAEEMALWAKSLSLKIQDFPAVKLQIVLKELSDDIMQSFPEDLQNLIRNLPEETQTEVPIELQKSMWALPDEIKLKLPEELQELIQNTPYDINKSTQGGRAYLLKLLSENIRGKFPKKLNELIDNLPDNNVRILPDRVHSLVYPDLDLVELNQVVADVSTLSEEQKEVIGKSYDDSLFLAVELPAKLQDCNARLRAVLDYVSEYSKDYLDKNKDADQVNEDEMLRVIGEINNDMREVVGKFNVISDKMLADVTLFASFNDLAGYMAKKAHGAKKIINSVETKSKQVEKHVKDVFHNIRRSSYRLNKISGLTQEVHKVCESNDTRLKEISAHLEEYYKDCFRKNKDVDQETEHQILSAIDKINYDMHRFNTVSEEILPDVTSLTAFDDLVGYIEKEIYNVKKNVSSVESKSKQVEKQAKDAFHHIRSSYWLNKISEFTKEVHEVCESSDTRLKKISAHLEECYKDCLHKNKDVDQKTEHYSLIAIDNINYDMRAFNAVSEEILSDVTSLTAFGDLVGYIEKEICSVKKIVGSVESKSKQVEKQVKDAFHHIRSSHWLNKITGLSQEIYPVCILNDTRLKAILSRLEEYYKYCLRENKVLSESKERSLLKDVDKISCEMRKIANNFNVISEKILSELTSLPGYDDFADDLEKKMHSAKMIMNSVESKSKRTEEQAKAVFQHINISRSLKVVESHQVKLEKKIAEIKEEISYLTRVRNNLLAINERDKMMREVRFRKSIELNKKIEKLRGEYENYHKKLVDVNKAKELYGQNELAAKSLVDKYTFNQSPELEMIADDKCFDCTKIKQTVDQIPMVVFSLDSRTPCVTFSRSAPPARPESVEEHRQSTSTGSVRTESESKRKSHTWRDSIESVSQEELDPTKTKQSIEKEKSEDANQSNNQSIEEDDHQDRVDQSVLDIVDELIPNQKDLTSEQQEVLAEFCNTLNSIVKDLIPSIYLLDSDLNSFSSDLAEYCNSEAYKVLGYEDRELVKKNVLSKIQAIIQDGKKCVDKFMDAKNKIRFQVSLFLQHKELGEYVVNKIKEIGSMLKVLDGNVNVVKEDIGHWFGQTSETRGDISVARQNPGAAADQDYVNNAAPRELNLSEEQRAIFDQAVADSDYLTSDLPMSLADCYRRLKLLSNIIDYLPDNYVGSSRVVVAHDEFEKNLPVEELKVELELIARETQRYLSEFEQIKERMSLNRSVLSMNPSLYNAILKKISNLNESVPEIDQQKIYISNRIKTLTDRHSAQERIDETNGEAQMPCGVEIKEVSSDSCSDSDDGVEKEIVDNSHTDEVKEMNSKELDLTFAQKKDVIDITLKLTSLVDRQTALMDFSRKRLGSLLTEINDSADESVSDDEGSVEQGVLNEEVKQGLLLILRDVSKCRSDLKDFCELVLSKKNVLSIAFKELYPSVNRKINSLIEEMKAMDAEVEKVEEMISTRIGGSIDSRDEQIRRMQYDASMDLQDAGTGSQEDQQSGYFSTSGSAHTKQPVAGTNYTSLVDDVLLGESKQDELTSEQVNAVYQTLVDQFFLSESVIYRMRVLKEQIENISEKSGAIAECFAGDYFSNEDRLSNIDEAKKVLGQIYTEILMVGRLLMKSNFDFVKTKNRYMSNRSIIEPFASLKSSVQRQINSVNNDIRYMFGWVMELQNEIEVTNDDLNRMEAGSSNSDETISQSSEEEVASAEDVDMQRPEDPISEKNTAIHEMQEREEVPEVQHEVPPEVKLEVPPELPSEVPPEVSEKSIQVHDDVPPEKVDTESDKSTVIKVSESKSTQNNEVAEKDVGVNHSQQTEESIGTQDTENSNPLKRMSKIQRTTAMQSAKVRQPNLRKLANRIKRDLHSYVNDSLSVVFNDKLSQAKNNIPDKLLEEIRLIGYYLDQGINEKDKKTLDETAEEQYEKKADKEIEEDKIRDRMVALNDVLAFYLVGHENELLRKKLGDKFAESDKIAMKDLNDSSINELRGKVLLIDKEKGLRELLDLYYCLKSLIKLQSDIDQSLLDLINNQDEFFGPGVKPMELFAQIMGIQDKKDCLFLEMQSFLKVIPLEDAEKLDIVDDNASLYSQYIELQRFMKVIPESVISDEKKKKLRVMFYDFWTGGRSVLNQELLEFVKVCISAYGCLPDFVKMIIRTGLSDLQKEVRERGETQDNTTQTKYLYAETEELLLELLSREPADDAEFFALQDQLEKHRTLAKKKKLVRLGLLKKSAVPKKTYDDDHDLDRVREEYELLSVKKNIDSALEQLQLMKKEETGAFSPRLRHMPPKMTRITQTESKEWGELQLLEKSEKPEKSEKSDSVRESDTQETDPHTARTAMVDSSTQTMVEQLQAEKLQKTDKAVEASELDGQEPELASLPERKRYATRLAAKVKDHLTETEPVVEKNNVISKEWSQSDPDLTLLTSVHQREQLLAQSTAKVNTYKTQIDAAFRSKIDAAFRTSSATSAQTNLSLTKKNQRDQTVQTDFSFSPGSTEGYYELKRKPAIDYLTEKNSEVVDSYREKNRMSEQNAYGTVFGNMASIFTLHGLLAFKGAVMQRGFEEKTLNKDEMPIDLSKQGFGADNGCGAVHATDDYTESLFIPNLLVRHNDRMPPVRTAYRKWDYRKNLTDEVTSATYSNFYQRYHDKAQVRDPLDKVLDYHRIHHYHHRPQVPAYALTEVNSPTAKKNSGK